MRTLRYCLLIILFCMNINLYADDEPYTSPKNSIKSGEYLAVIGGCHDCHTPNFAQKEGKVPVNDYLTGTQYGFKGPWGVTYPANLRLFVQKFTEKEWVQLLKYTTGKPPMPWVATHKMSKDDLSSLYKYIKSLGPSGLETPSATSPGDKPKTDYIYFVPVKDK